jgi:hypothetical protein
VQSYWRVVEIADAQVLVEKGITTASEIASQIDIARTSMGAGRGPRMVRS